MIHNIFSYLRHTLKCFFGSCFLLPLGAAAVLLAGFSLDYVCEWIYHEWHVWPPVLRVLSYIGGFLFLLGVLAGLSVPLWLFIMTIRLFRRGETAQLLRCWGASALAGVVAIGVGMGLVTQAFSGSNGDDFARGLAVPSDREFVLPRGLTLFCNREIPQRVRELHEMAAPLPTVESNEVADVMNPEQSIPNLRKLSREAPELLHEYLLRVLYAEATDPRFNSPLLDTAGPYPAHENDPQTHARRAYLAQRHVFSPEGETTYADYPIARWRIPLQNGWYMAHTVTWHERDLQPAEHPEIAARLHRIDTALAPLAHTPTREQLDALLPPLPKHPFLCIHEETAGCYDMLIVIPAEYEAGTFELRAHEVTTGKPISFRQDWHAEKKLGNVCRVICSNRALTVFSGNWGEYYGSEWQIWFTPATGGAPRCVSSQPFVMMGWQR